MFIQQIYFQSFKLQTIHMSIDRLRDKQKCVYPYNGILFSNKKALNIDIYCSIHPELKKLDAKKKNEKYMIPFT